MRIAAARLLGCVCNKYSIVNRCSCSSTDLYDHLKWVFSDAIEKQNDYELGSGLQIGSQRICEKQKGFFLINYL